MKMLKKNGGFTLVELIIVIAILAILAGVAVPAYSGYLTKANEAAIVTELDAIQTAVNAANASKGQVTKISIADDGKTITITGASAENFVADFKTFYGEAKVAATPAPSTTTITLVNEIKNWTSTNYKTGANWTPANGWKVGA